MQIDIPEEIGQRLRELAHQRGVSIADLLKSLLDRTAPEPPARSLAEMAQNAREANLASAEPVDTAARSRNS